MKKIFLVLFCMTLFVNADLSVNQIQEMVVKIHQKRPGVKLKTLETTNEPFVRLEEKDNVVSVVIPQENSTEAKLDLHAILNGRAYINDSWMDINDTILGYTLKFVGKKGVVLRNDNHIKKLFLHHKDNNLITFEGR